MKKILFAAAGIAAVCFIASSFSTPVRGAEEPKSPVVVYEYAIVKYEAPDFLYENLPSPNGVIAQIFEVGKQGIELPKPPVALEEFCLTFSCKLMARTGWEPFKLEGERIMFRRPTK